MKPLTAIKKGALACIFLAIPALASHHMQVISTDEYIGRRLQYPEEEFSLFIPRPEDQKHFTFWRDRLVDTSLSVVGPCRPAGRLGAAERCLMPPFPPFPLDAFHRNKVLGRPDLEVVRQNIELATKGELSTVAQLVEKVMGNLDTMDRVSDDELSLLASNFVSPEAGLVATAGCGTTVYGGVWPEDLLVPEDEKRALLAAWLYVVSDEGYISRRFAELEVAVKSRGGDSAADLLEQDDGDGGNGRKLESERESHVKRQEGKCLSGVLRCTHLFQERVKQLDAEVLLSENDWMERYTEFMAALRAELWNMVPREMWSTAVAQGWDSVETIVSETEKIVDGDIYCGIPIQEQGFSQFLEGKEGEIRTRYPDIGRGILGRIAYRRWKLIPAEGQAVYLTG